MRPTVSLNDAESYFASRLRSEIWDAADENSKTRALTQASFLISGAFVFSTNSYEQDENGAVAWHERIIAAVCEEAHWLLSRDPSELPAALFQGVASASVGGASATFDKSFVIPWICPVAKTLVGDLGTFIDSDDDSRIRSAPLPL